MSMRNFTDGIYLVDFEFHPLRDHEGNPPSPVCMVVRDWPSGHTVRYWQDELKRLEAPPSVSYTHLTLPTNREV